GPRRSSWTPAAPPSVVTCAPPVSTRSRSRSPPARVTMPNASGRARRSSDARTGGDAGIRLSAPPSHSAERARPLLGLRVELHRTEHVAFRVLKEHQRTDADDDALLHD